ncbi:hypothetical protein K432DRAFT_381314 [Lepidopterella palustris CBS 459.81]|uniref:Uncharacterized protein n=1 Tax=Lepidopterella palustris CBS 459.81 TaxID=1314670 RepID=A0A8E2JG73_9PEZI|nr:hypothetical protein K432DRAFT_381314 [Lepidopterella palustris CBS 459.81]
MTFYHIESSRKSWASSQRMRVRMEERLKGLAHLEVGKSTRRHLKKRFNRLPREA